MTSAPSLSYETGYLVNRLMRHPVDSKSTAWSGVLERQDRINRFLQPIGLRLYLDEDHGFAFLEADPHRPETMPQLVQKSHLGAEAALVALFLRDRYRTFEQEDADEDRLLVTAGEALEYVQSIYPDASNEANLTQQVVSALKRFQRSRLLKPVGDSDDTWKIQHITRALLDAQWLLRFEQAITPQDTEDAPAAQAAPSDDEEEETNQ